MPSPPEPPALAPPGTVVESRSLLTASRVRQLPFTLFFPLGVVLSWAGISHWLLHALGVLADYRPVFHATVQTQGFLTCLAVGFLFTMIPRRTGTGPPTSIEIGLGALGPVLVAIAAWNSWLAVAQIAWLVTAVTLIRFVVSRFLSAEAQRRPPNGFVWIPFAFVVGVVGAAMQLLAAISGQETLWTQVGRGLVQQGLFIALVLGVGSLALPLMTRGQGPPDGTATGADRLVRLGHLLGGVLLVGSFWVEAELSLRLAMALRAGIITIAFLVEAQIWRRPERPGWNARLILMAAWMLPLGYLMAAIYPLRFRAGLHVSLIGGLGLLTLAISAQVILGHGGYRDVLFGRSAALATMGMLMVAAIVARVAMEFDQLNALLWMGTAAALFLLATVAWWVAVSPGLYRPRNQ